jgi:hypothetical protein
MKSQRVCLEVKRRRAGAGGAGGRVVVGAAMDAHPQEMKWKLCGSVEEGYRCVVELSTRI